MTNNTSSLNSLVRALERELSGIPESFLDDSNILLFDGIECSPLHFNIKLEMRTPVTTSLSSSTTAKGMFGGIKDCKVLIELDPDDAHCAAVLDKVQERLSGAGAFNKITLRHITIKNNIKTEMTAYGFFITQLSCEGSPLGSDFWRIVGSCDHYTIDHND